MTAVASVTATSSSADFHTRLTPNHQTSNYDLILDIGGSASVSRLRG